MTRRRLAILPALLALLAVPALAGRAPADVDPQAVGALVPEDVRIVVALDGAADVRTSPVGRVVVDLASLAGVMDGIAPPWAELADALGMTQERAFDELLGTRVVFASRFGPADDHARQRDAAWALMSWVAPDTADLLRQRLRAAPRDMLGGRPVLTIDGGRLGLLLGPTERGRRVLLIGPTDRRDLFDELGRSLDRGPDRPLADSAGFDRVTRLGRRGDAFILGRARDDGGPWIAALAEHADRRIDVSFLLADPAPGDAAPASVRTWSRDTFDALSRDVYALVLDQNDLGGHGRSLPRLGPGLPLPPEVRALMADRRALLARPAAAGPIEIALAVETLDVAEMSEVGDQLVEDLVRALPGGERLGDRVASLRATPPLAVRTVDVSRAIPALEEFGWRAGPWLSWRGRATGEPCDPGQAPGWWTVGLGTAAVDDLSHAVATPTEGVSLPWMSLGVVRPGELLRALARAGAPAPDVLAPLQRVREVGWEALRMGEGMVVGLGRLEVGPLEWAGDEGDADSMAGYREGSPGGGAVGDGGRR